MRSGSEQWAGPVKGRLATSKGKARESRGSRVGGARVCEREGGQTSSRGRRATRAYYERDNTIKHKYLIVCTATTVNRKRREPGSTERAQTDPDTGAQGEKARGRGLERHEW